MDNNSNKSSDRIEFKSCEENTEEQTEAVIVKDGLCEELF